MKPISFTEALRHIQEETIALPQEKVPVDQACGRVLGETIVANSPAPPFDNAAMDGIVTRYQDVVSASTETPVALRVKGYIPAGKADAFSIEQGECYTIATGSMIPRGGDTVIPKEIIVFKNNACLIRQAPNKGANIRLRGTHFDKGELLLREGSTLTPENVTLLASLGLSEITCSLQPHATVISTGSELQPPGSALKSNSIYDSNSYMLQALAREAGCSVTRIGGIPDTPRSILEVLEQALARCDILLLSGGMSVGEKDYALDCFEKASVRKIFHTINLKPGKPLYFGIWATSQRKIPVFGFPGNPAAVCLAFRHLTLPAIAKMTNANAGAEIRAILDANVITKLGRTELIISELRQCSETMRVTPVLAQNASNIAALSRGNSSFAVDENTIDLRAGSTITVTQWNRGVCRSV